MATQTSDKHVQLVIGGAKSIADKSTGAGWTEAFTTKTYGSETDIWEPSISAAAIENAAFGAAVAVGTTEAARTMEIDSMSIKVYYVTYTTIEFSAENVGDVTAYPIIKVYGDSSSITIENSTTSQSLILGGIHLKKGEYYEINFKNHTIKLNGTSYAYNALEFSLSSWWGLEPGKNTIKVKGAKKAEISWQDTFI